MERKGVRGKIGSEGGEGRHKVNFKSLLNTYLSSEGQYNQNTCVAMLKREVGTRTL